MTAKQRKQIKDFISKTDWNKFWQNVTKKAAEEIDGYEKARAKSKEIIHWFR